MEHHALLQVLRADGLLAGYADSDLSLQLLTGGFWNQVLRLRSAADPALDWVVKRFAKAPPNPLFPILPTAEHAALQFLQGHGCAPRPIAFVADKPGTSPGSVLVYEYLPGSGWDGDVAAAARLLAQVHRLPLDAVAHTRFRPLPIEPADLLAHAEQMLQQHATDLGARVRAACPPLHSQPAFPRHANALVHTDCGPGNMVSTPQGLRLIDWQCPGIGDGLQDVVTFLSPAMQILYGHAPLTPAQVGQFVEAYFEARGGQGNASSAGRLRLSRVQAAHHYRFAAYCALRTQDTAATDERTSRLYATALEAELLQLQRLSREDATP